MQNKKKWKIRAIVLFTCLSLLFVFSGVSHAEPSTENPDVNVEAPTDDTDLIYERYKDNTFELMTKEGRGIKANVSVGIKSFMWSGVVGLGKFNAEMVRFMFGLDIVSPVKKPIQDMTSGIAKNMTSLASTIGICVVAFIFLIKYFGEQRYKEIFRIFIMTITIFTMLSILADGRTNDTVFTKMMDIDSAVEAKFVSINPVFGDNSIGESVKEKDKNGNEVERSASASEKLKSSADLIASRIFRSNIYEPYLLMQYGTSDTEKIRKNMVELKKIEYDRIGILLDNDIAIGENEKIYDSVVKFESKELNNNNIHYSNSFTVAGFSAFYMIINLIQMIIFFILAMLRIILAFLQLMLWPLLPILLLVGLLNFENNVFINYWKAFGMTVFLKSMTGVACIIFAMYVTFGFQASSAVENPYQKMLTILVYILAPIGVYFFRFIIGAMFTGRMNMRMVGHALANPVKTNRLLQNQSKERAKEAKEKRKEAKAKRKAGEKEDDPEGAGKKENEPKAPKSTKNKRSDHRNGETDKKEEKLNEPKNEEAEKDSEKEEKDSKNINEAKGKGNRSRRRNALRGGQIQPDPTDENKNDTDQPNTVVNPKARRRKRNNGNKVEDSSQNDNSTPINANGVIVASKEPGKPTSMPQPKTTLNPKSRRRKMGSRVTSPERTHNGNTVTNSNGNTSEGSDVPIYSGGNQVAGTEQTSIINRQPRRASVKKKSKLRTTKQTKNSKRNKKSASTKIPKRSVTRTPKSRK